MFVEGLSPYMIKDGRAAILTPGMDKGRLIVHLQQVESDGITLRETIRAKKQKVESRSQSRSKSAPQNFKAPSQVSKPQPQSSKVSKAFSQSASSGTRTYPLCAKCGKHHLGECRAGLGVCFTCNQPGHIASECPSATKGCFGCGKSGHMVKDCPHKG